MKTDERKEPYCNTFDARCAYHFESLSNKIDGLSKLIENLNKTVIGNGDMRNSLVMENSMNTVFRKRTESWIWVIVAASTSGFIALFWNAAKETVLK